MPSISGMPVSKDVADLYYKAHPDEAEIAKVTSQSASKYRNTRETFRGMSFQSGHEMEVCAKFVLLDERHAGVHGLRLQVDFLLPGGIVYRADGTYLDDRLEGRVFDAKAWDVKTQKFLRTAEYRLKRKLFKAVYGKEIEEL